MLENTKEFGKIVSFNAARDPWGLGRGGSADEYTRLLLSVAGRREHSRISQRVRLQAHQSCGTGEEDTCIKGKDRSKGKLLWP